MWVPMLGFNPTIKFSESLNESRNSLNIELDHKVAPWHWYISLLFSVTES